MSLNLGTNTMLPLQQLGSAGMLANTAYQPDISLTIPTVADFIKKYNGKGSRIITNRKLGQRFLIDYEESIFEQAAYVETDKEKNSVSYQATQLFYSLEFTITDHVLFWVLFGDRFIGSELNCLFADEIKDAINRFDRLSHPIGHRVRWSNWIRVTSRQYEIKATGKSEAKKPEVGKILQWVRKHKDNDPITGFRGFLCRKELGHRIRKSDVKGDGDFWTQIEGAGTSYTLDPNVAAKFASRRTDFKSFHNVLLRLSSGIDLLPHHHKAPDADWYMKTRETEEGRDSLQREYVDILGGRIDDEKQVFEIDNVKIQPVVDAIMTKTDNRLIRLAADLMNMEDRPTDAYGDEPDETYAGFGVRAVVGRYQFFKEDIITIFDFEDETELMVFPDAVSLQRYEFLSSNQIVGEFLTEAIGKTE